MEAKRGSSSGEAAGNANALSISASETSSSTTSTNKKNAAPPPSLAPEKPRETPSLFFDLADRKTASSHEVPEPASHEKADARTGDKHDHDTAAEKQQVPEHLTPEQELDVVADYTNERLEVVEAELEAAKEQSANAAIAHADKVLLENIARAVQQRSETASAEAILNEASAHAEEALQMSHDVEPDSETPHELTDAERDDLINAILHDPEEPSVFTDETADSLPVTYDDITSAPVTAASSGGTGGTPPPTTERFSDSGDDDDARAGEMYAIPGAIDGSGSSDGPAVAAARMSERSTERRPTPNTAQRRPVLNNGLLLGGVLGYALGRHHGRRKAERSFKPEQLHLKKEVDALQQKIIAHEQHIRSLAAQKVIAEQAVGRSISSETTAVMPMATARALHEKASAPVSAAVVPELNPSVSASIAAHEKETHPMLVGRPEGQRVPREAAEAVKPARRPSPERPAVPVAPRGAESRPKLELKDVAQLTQSELQAVAETIPVKGQSLRKIYETGQIDKDGLRRIVTEYVRSGRIERLVTAEVAARQFKRRSPELQRGTAMTSAQTPVASNATQGSPIGDAFTPLPAEMTYNEQGQSSTAVGDHKKSPDPNVNGRVIVSIAVAIAVVLIALATRLL